MGETGAKGVTMHEEIKNRLYRTWTGLNRGVLTEICMLFISQQTGSSHKPLHSNAGYNSYSQLVLGSIGM